MTRATKLTLALLALSAACGDAGSDDDTNTIPAQPAFGADAGGIAVPPASPDAATQTPIGTLNPTTPTGMSTGTQTARPDAGITNIPDAASPLVDAGPKPDSGTSTGTPVANNCPAAPSGMPGSTANLMLNGRNYTLHIGKTVKPNEPAPLVFSLHGLTMTPASMELMAQWDPVADRDGIIIARPAGVGASNGWDLTGTKDFDLMKAIIEDVNAKACVDRKRIFATGFSHGGFMSFSLACRLGDIFAAVAPNSGAGSAARGCVARAVPVYAFHGDADGTVSYSSGKSAVDSWVTHDKCTGTPTSFMVGNATCQDWNMCAEGSEVKFCTIPGGGHTYTRAATAAIWDFFKAHPLP
jgi:polyhydroxybutyrate depolymerase